MSSTEKRLLSLDASSGPDVAACHVRTCTSHTYTHGFPTHRGRWGRAQIPGCTSTRSPGSRKGSKMLAFAHCAVNETFTKTPPSKSQTSFFFFPMFFPLRFMTGPVSCSDSTECFGGIGGVSKRIRIEKTQKKKDTPKNLKMTYMRMMNTPPTPTTSQEGMSDWAFTLFFVLLVPAQRPRNLRQQQSQAIIPRHEAPRHVDHYRDRQR